MLESLINQNNCISIIVILMTVTLITLPFAFSSSGINLIQRKMIIGKLCFVLSLLLLVDTVNVSKPYLNKEIDRIQYQNYVNQLENIN